MKMKKKKEIETMNKLEAIEMVLRSDVSEGQDAWEMVQDGYCGDIDAYIQDYKDDYMVEESDGVVIVSRIGYPNDEPRWFIENGTVRRK